MKKTFLLLIFILTSSLNFSQVQKISDSKIRQNGNNYLPLNVGNKWEQLSIHNTGGIHEPRTDYGMKVFEVMADTLIEQDIFFKCNGFLEKWLRYDKILNILFIYDNFGEYVLCDFSKSDGETYYSYSSYSDSSLVEAVETIKILFGQNVNCKGFTKSNWLTMETILFAEDFGFYSVYLSFSDNGEYYSAKTSQSIQYNSSGNIVLYPHGYLPMFTQNPKQIIGGASIGIVFEVDHVYTIFSYDDFWGVTGLNYVDEVILEYFYEKKDSISEIDTIFASNFPHSIKYTVSLPMDSTYLNSDYELNYRLIAKEIGILGTTSTLPDSGYFSYQKIVTSIDAENIPTIFSLSQNYPNPFNPATTIKYVIAEETFVNISVFDVLGRKVAVLVNENKSPGEYQVEFNAEKFNSGIFFYQIDAGNFAKVKKMLFLK